VLASFLMIYRRGSLHGQAYHSTGTADRANEPPGGLIREQDYYPGGIITIVIRAPEFKGSTRKFNEYVLYHITDYQSARRFALASTWWSTNRNHFLRTEAIDLLKTKDRSRDRTQHEPISEVHQGGRQKGATLRKMGRIVWLMSMYNMMGAAALFREEETELRKLRGDASQAENSVHVPAGEIWGTGTQRQAVGARAPW